MSKLAFIFPGQGAQVPGMGKEFYQRSKEIFQEADDILSEKLSEMIFSGSAEELSQTRNSQLAIFVTSMAILRAVQKELSSFVPTVCGGLSLGEYTALCGSNRLSFKETLQLVKIRSEAMEAACKENKGGMRVVLGLSLDQVKELLPPQVWIANLNCPGQIVISGEISALEKAQTVLKERGAKRVLPLQVSGAFHTPFMQSAAEKLEKAIMNCQFKEGSSDMVLNVTGDYLTQVEDLPNHLVKQLTHSVLWESCIRAMEKRGIQTYIEMGPGKSLTGMNRKIGISGSSLSVEKISDLDELAKNLENSCC